jgi:hypothetical protein
MEMQSGLGMGAYQGRARSVSIAVQRLGAEFSGPVLQTHARAFARGHGRGKVCIIQLDFWIVTNVTP